MRQQERLLVRQAANWFARMHGPDAVSHKADFETWVAASEGHREAYSRVSEAFSLGKGLKSKAPPNATGSGGHGRKLLAIMALLVAGIWAASFTARRYGLLSAAQSPAIVTSDLVTRTGEIRTARLSDGSMVTLDTGSELATRFGADRRDLWLVRGRARFDVAHERRAFIVHAGDGTVTAHGTLFDVRVEGHVASVRLLRGAIDVSLPPHGEEPATTRHVTPGEALAFDSDKGIEPITTLQNAAIAQPTWPLSLLEFDDARVSDVIAEANRYSTRSLIIGDPAIANMRVSGTFRVGDTDRLGSHLALLLGVQIAHRSTGDPVLTYTSH